MIIDRLNGKFQREFVDTENKMNTTPNTTLDDFLNQIENPNTRKKYDKVKDFLYGLPLDLSVDEYINVLNEYTLSLKGRYTTTNSVKTILSMIRRYAIYTNNYNLIESLSTPELYYKNVSNELKPTEKLPFISYSQFKQFILDINNSDELNAFYTTTLFSAIYEGIYNENGKVLLNLRASDITCDNGINYVAKLNDGENVYDFVISKSLAENLINLGHEEMFEGRKRYYYATKAEGLYPDSCFKVIPRADGKSIEDSVLDFIWRTIRKTTDKYMSYQINTKKTKNIFISGLMHRLSKKFKEKRLDFIKYFEYPNFERSEAKDVIEEELKRCNFNIEIPNLRNLVRGYCYLFVEPDTVKSNTED